MPIGLCAAQVLLPADGIGFAREIPQPFDLLRRVDGAAQFDLPFARFPRGDYRLQVRAVSDRETVTNLVMIRVIG